MPRARHCQQDSNFRTNPSGGWHGRIVPKADIAAALTFETR
jgi:hypothetical protein